MEHVKLKNLVVYAWLITYFGNFVFGFFINLVAWFSVRCFPFARQDGQDEMKNKQTIMEYFRNFLDKNKVTKMGWNAQKYVDLTKNNL